MFSAISAESFDPDEPISLMLTVITRTLSGLRGILERVHFTRQRMERSSQEGSPWNNSPQDLYLQLKIRGLRSSLAKIEGNFLRLLRTSALGISLPNSEACTRLQNGSGLSSAWYTSVPSGSNLQIEIFLSWLHTETQFWMYEVSDPSGRGAGFSSLLGVMTHWSCARPSVGARGCPRHGMDGRARHVRTRLTRYSWTSKIAHNMGDSSHRQNDVGAIARQPHLHAG